MLNLFVRFMRLRLLLPLFLLLTAAQDSPPVVITAPAADEVLRGQVTITGTMDVPGFVSAQLDFAYASNLADSWFNIQTFSEPRADSTLAVWDTTSITDGDYVLRLRVNLADGAFQEVTVPVQVGNDAVPTPALAPTATPEAVSVLVPTPFLLAASPTPTEVPRPTPTALPVNPASLEQDAIFASLGRGALVILGLFVLAGLIIRIRRF